MPGRLRKIVPYIVVLGAAAFLYWSAMHIEFAAPEGRIGPDFWPKAILIFAMAACAYEIVKTVFFSHNEHELAGVLDTIVVDVPQDGVIPVEPEEKIFPHLLWAGVGLTLAYLLLIEVLGFFLCTFLYLAVFMWIGRYRRAGVVLATSLAGSLVFMFVFMKIVYVSLPLGSEPFSEISFLLMRLMGIK